MVENFMLGGVVSHVTNLNPSYVDLLWVELGFGFDNSVREIARPTQAIELIYRLINEANLHFQWNTLY